MPTDLSNWRQAPHNRWAFQHVGKLIPCAKVSAAKSAQALPLMPGGLEEIRLQCLNHESLTLSNWLNISNTDEFLALHQGKVVFSWQARHRDIQQPHIIFSVSKSITGLLCGILIDQDLLNRDAPVAAYLPELDAAGYGGCTVEHLLDMTAAIEFSEDYLDDSGQFAQYRASTGWNPISGDHPDATLRQFLSRLRRQDRAHGDRFKYMSPNSDLLGWVLESASDRAYASILSEHLWQPMGARHDAAVTVDSEGTARAAGGICAHAEDLARVGELMRNNGQFNARTIVSEHWVQDTVNHGSYSAWRNGSFPDLLPNGRYRNGWYQVNNASGAFFAIGIHGQWIYVDPGQEVTLVKLSSQPEPVDEILDICLLDGFNRIAEYLSK